MHSSNLVTSPHARQTQNEVSSTTAPLSMTQDFSQSGYQPTATRAGGHRVSSQTHKWQVQTANQSRQKQMHNYLTGFYTGHLDISSPEQGPVSVAILKQTQMLLSRMIPSTRATPKQDLETSQSRTTKTQDVRFRKHLPQAAPGLAQSVGV